MCSPRSGFGVSEGSWKVLGPKSPNLGPKNPKSPKKSPKGDQLPPPWCFPFGEVLGPCWAQESKKSDLEGMQKRHQLRHRFFIDFGASWTSFWEGFAAHVGFQNRQKINVKLTSKFVRFFYRCWYNFSRILDALETSFCSSRSSGVHILRI